MVKKNAPVEKKMEEKIAKPVVAKTAKIDCMMYNGGVETGVIVRAGEEIPKGFKDSPTKAK